MTTINDWSHKLINEEPLLVLPTLATDLGVSKAIALQQLHFWLSVAKKGKIGKFEDGRFWIYDSWSEWVENFPFWNIRTIQRLFASLEKDGLILIQLEEGAHIVGGKRIWYTIDYDAVDAAVGREKEAIGKTPIPPIGETPIPSGQNADTFTETTSEIADREEKQSRFSHASKTKGIQRNGPPAPSDNPGEKTSTDEKPVQDEGDKRPRPILNWISIHDRGEHQEYSPYPLGPVSWETSSDFSDISAKNILPLPFQERMKYNHPRKSTLFLLV